MNGWTVPDCHEAIIVTRYIQNSPTPCLAVRTPDDFLCVHQHPIQQLVPWLVPGTWELRGWLAGAPLGQQTYGAYISLSSSSNIGGPSLAAIGNYGHLWTFHSQLFEITPGMITDSLRVNLFAEPAGVEYTSFDEIEIVAALPTGIAPPPGAMLNFRPNPATDKIWIDLDATLNSIVALDITGRETVIPVFDHQGHTAQVDVSLLPPGPCFLRLNTASGVRTLRFIKN